MRQKKACMCWSMAALAIMALIFFFSSDTASASDAKSGVFVDLLLPFAAWLDADMLSFLMQGRFIHALLGICVGYGAVSCGEGSGGRPLDHLRQLYACSDELHQMMVMGRSAQPEGCRAGQPRRIVRHPGFRLWIIAWKRKRDQRVAEKRPAKGSRPFLLLRG